MILALNKHCTAAQTTIYKCSCWFLSINFVSSVVQMDFWISCFIFSKSLQLRCITVNCNFLVRKKKCFPIQFIYSFRKKKLKIIYLIWPLFLLFFVLNANVHIKISLLLFLFTQNILINQTLDYIFNAQDLTKSIWRRRRK